MLYLQIITDSRKLGFRYLIIVMLVMFQLLAVLFESVGLGLLLPVFEFIQAKGDMALLEAKATYWKHIMATFEWLGLPLNLATLFAISFSAIMARQVFSYFRTTFEFASQEKVIRFVRMTLFERFLCVRLEYRDKQQLGEIVNHFVTEVPRAISAVINVIRVISAILMFGCYVTMLVTISWQMTTLTFSLMGVSVVLLLPLLRRTKGYGAAITEANRDLGVFLTERLSALRLIRLSGAERQESLAMSKLSWKQVKRLCQLNFLIARVDSVMEPFVAVLGFSFLYLGTEVLGLSLGEIGVFVLVTLRMFPPLKETLKHHQQVLAYSHSQALIARALNDLHIHREIDGGAREFTGLRDAIDIRGLTFAYDGRSHKPALDNVSLSFPAGKMTAVVGPSGSGKSTLIDLIPGLRRPTSGEALFDGVPAGDFTIASLRAHIAYVPQSPSIFNVTVGEHIRYGQPDASQDQVEDAARQAGALDFIRALPHGFDTMLGEGGSSLSGGQKQRLDIARALLRRPSLLILDEPTSALDADAETAFRDTLANLRRNPDITIIVIAHRLATIANADQIVVLREGQVEGIGSHAQLSAQGGWYAEGLAKQAKVHDRPGEIS